ncbi:MAG: hypothetical protein MI922_20805 [Bacteroidales bacterium]|nr:hypothetical protein [Bacteroidales bacterium]
MKRLNLFLGMLLLSIYVQQVNAQWSENATSIWTTNFSKNVGIGTSNPIEKLSIAGKGATIELGAGVPKEANAGKIAYQRWSDGLDIVGVGSNPNNRKITFFCEGGANFYGRIWATNVYTTKVETPGLEAQNAKVGLFEVGMGVHKEKNAGKIAYKKWSDGLDIVGAGTQVSNRKITFFNEGGATFRGVVNAPAIKVRANFGADFVFNDDYELMDLHELEEFVKENKHLPEIDSEEEMIKNGVDVHTMQIKLLQKVEELSLYIIEQNKELEKLKSIVEHNPVNQ